MYNVNYILITTDNLISKLRNLTRLILWLQSNKTKNQFLEKDKLQTFSGEMQVPYRFQQLPITFERTQGTHCQKKSHRASLLAQWLRICLPMQGTWVRALVWEDPTCCGTTKSVCHNYWACAFGACAPQQERPRQWEARGPRWRVAPTRRN